MAGLSLDAHDLVHELVVLAVDLDLILCKAVGVGVIHLKVERPPVDPITFRQSDVCDKIQTVNGDLIDVNDLTRVSLNDELFELSRELFLFLFHVD